MPEEEVPNGLTLEGSAEQELAKGTIQIRLKLEHLYQLEQVHQQLVITVEQERAKVIDKTVIFFVCTLCNTTDIPWPPLWEIYGQP